MEEETKIVVATALYVYDVIDEPAAALELPNVRVDVTACGD